MKITRVIISNFRCFYGPQIPIEFNVDGKITLIYGLSGSGKTTMLDFFNWTFYGIEPKDKNKSRSNKPLYNIKSMNECLPNNEIEVSGTIIFIHKNVEYKVIRKRKYKKTFTSTLPMPEQVSLYYRKIVPDNVDDNIGYIPYEKNYIGKINEIVPQSLSRYFFFAGEDGGALANSDVNLASSIYSMFDLKKYDEALRHIGDRTTRNSILGQFAKEKADYKSKGIIGDSRKIYDEMVKYAEYRKAYQAKYEAYNGYIEKLNSDLKELYKLVGSTGGKSAEKINESIEMNKKMINTELDSISRNKNSIGRILASVAPYLLLSGKAVEVRNSLANQIEKDNERRKKMNTFVDLGRPLLLDIQKKGECVCGRALDDLSLIHINDTLKLLPPSSYSLIFQQFVESTKNKIYSAETKYSEISNKLTECLKSYNEIDAYSKKNSEYLEDLASIDIDKIKTLTDSIKAMEIKIKEYEKNKQFFYTEMEKGRRGETKYSSDYDKISKNQTYRDILDDKIEIMNEIKNQLSNTFEKKKSEVRKTLEESIKKIYIMLSTRQEDFSDKNFLKSDFSLRDEYKTGGQELIDVYSYVIGMVKALNETGNEDSEFPVIVDAPFSKTDELQLAHVIETMPKIVSQVAFFTFDKIRIKEFADTSAIGTVWELCSDETQENSKIIRGDL